MSGIDEFWGYVSSNFATHLSGMADWSLTLRDTLGQIHGHIFGRGSYQPIKKESDVQFETEGRSVHWSSQARSLALSRHSEAIQAIYYWSSADRILFASRLPRLLNLLGEVSLRFEVKCLVDLLTFGYVLAPLTAFAGVRQILPGTRLFRSLDIHGAAEVIETIPAKKEGVFTYVGQANGAWIAATSESVRTRSPTLLPSVAMYNELAYCVAAMGEPIADVGVPRFVMRVRTLGPSPASWDIVSDRWLSPSDANSKKLEASLRGLLKPAWQRQLIDYWMDERLPSLLALLGESASSPEISWQRRFGVVERQRTMTRLTHIQKRKVHFRFDNLPPTGLDAQNIGEMFTVNAPEAGSLFANALRLHDIDECFDLSLHNVRRSLCHGCMPRLMQASLCAAVSIDYLMRFSRRLPTDDFDQAIS